LILIFLVFEGTWQSTKVALKKFTADSARDFTEAKLLMKLRHPNIGKEKERKREKERQREREIKREREREKEK